ncbi:hypothetical protein QTG54_014380 [Skeletonema marinoi]|uniref:Uncharacterized protein n=1 Tax=Skeletonema marinoi TaxID=267567 RepID=A0AAD8XWX4_9STRA|nr:hypothetical protein QTG54_014380 [Skeletonema marinoi]
MGGMMGFRGGYYYYLPNEVGAESPRACPTATSASGWSHTPVTDLQRVYNGRPEEDEEGYAPSHYGASVVRLFPRTNPIHVDMDVLMENKWRQVQWGINWQFTSELETLLDVGGCEGKPCIGFLPITAGRDSSGGLPGVEFINGATGSDAQKRSQGIFVSEYGDNYSSNVGSHRKLCTMGRRACETAIHTLTARADGINATVRNNYCLVTEHAPLDVQPGSPGEGCEHEHRLSVVAALKDIGGPNSVAGKDEAEATFMALVESLGDKYPRSGEASEGLGGTHLGFSPKRRRSHEDEVGAGLAKMKGDIKNEERGLQEEIDTLKKEMGTAFDHITGVQLDVRTQQASAGPIDHVNALESKLSKCEKWVKGARGLSTSFGQADNSIEAATTFCGLLMNRLDVIEGTTKLNDVVTVPKGVKSDALTERVSITFLSTRAEGSTAAVGSLKHGGIWHVSRGKYITAIGNRFPQLSPEKISCGERTPNQDLGCVYPAISVSSLVDGSLKWNGSMIGGNNEQDQGDGDVISVCTMLPSRRALEQLRTVELSRITDVLRDFSVLRHPPLFLFEYCVNFLIDVMPWVDTNYDNMLSSTMYASIYEAEEGLRAVEGPAQVGALPRAASLAQLKVEGEDVPTLFQEMLVKDGERGAGAQEQRGLRLVRNAASEVACQVETDKALDTVVKERARNQRTQRSSEVNAATVEEEPTANICPYISGDEVPPVPFAITCGGTIDVPRASQRAGKQYGGRGRGTSQQADQGVSGQQQDGGITRERFCSQDGRPSEGSEGNVVEMERGITAVLLELARILHSVGERRSTALRDGRAPQFEVERAQRSSTEESQSLVHAEVNKVGSRMYIASGLVLSLTHMFDVPKPPSNIRMVYDGTESGHHLEAGEGGERNGVLPGLSWRGDFMEWIMGKKNPWSYVPLNEEAEQCSEGRASDWLGIEDWVRLHEVPGHRLRISPIAALSTVMEISAEDHLVNPHLAHVFVIPPTHDTNVDEAVVQGCRFEVFTSKREPHFGPALCSNH